MLPHSWNYLDSPKALVDSFACLFVSVAVINARMKATKWREGLLSSIKWELWGRGRKSQQPELQVPHHIAFTVKKQLLNACAPLSLSLLFIQSTVHPAHDV